jgi:hypothetical protein
MPTAAPVVHRLEQAFRQLDERFRVYQYVIKQPPAPLAPERHAHPLVDEPSRAAPTI